MFLGVAIGVLTLFLFLDHAVMDATTPDRADTPPSWIYQPVLTR